MSKSGIDFVTLIEAEEITDNAKEQDLSGLHVPRHISRQSSVGSASTNSLSSLDGSNTIDNNDEDYAETLKGAELEASSKGKVKGSTAMSYYRAGAHWSGLLLLLLSFLIVQLLASSTDIWVSVW